MPRNSTSLPRLLSSGPGPWRETGKNLRAQQTWAGVGPSICKSEEHPFTPPSTRLFLLLIHPPVHSFICQYNFPFIYPVTYHSPTYLYSFHPSDLPFIHLSIHPPTILINFLPLISQILVRYPLYPAPG